MNSIVVTYPNFLALPKGIKRMLVTSESLFFSEVLPQFGRCQREELPIGVVVHARNVLGQRQSVQALVPVWSN